MKKILFTLLAALSLSAFAQPKTVSIVYAFAPASTQAVMIRNLLENANKIQDKYQFVFTAKPGAGGSIAANSVLSSDSLTILAHTSSFYTRPLLYKESHDINQFSLIAQVCEKAPVGIFSRKYKSLEEMKDKEVTFAVIPGSITQLFAQSLSKSGQQFKVVEIFYKDAVTASNDMLGRHVDVSVDLVSAGNIARMTSDTNVLAVTGSTPVGDARPIKGLEHLLNNYWLFVPKTVDKQIQRELNSIFVSSINQRVRENCKDENGVLDIQPFEKLELIDRFNRTNWSNLTKHMEKQ